MVTGGVLAVLLLAIGWSTIAAAVAHMAANDAREERRRLKRDRENHNLIMTYQTGRTLR